MLIKLYFASMDISALLWLIHSAERCMLCDSAVSGVVGLFHYIVGNDDEDFTLTLWQFGWWCYRQNLNLKIPSICMNCHRCLHDS